MELYSPEVFSPYSGIDEARGQRVVLLGANETVEINPRSRNRPTCPTAVNSPRKDSIPTLQLVRKLDGGR